MTAFAGVSKLLTVNSSDGGVVIVTIAASPVDISPAAKPCQSCLVSIKTGTTVYMNINAAATSASWALSTTPIPVPVQDLSMLHFLGGSGSETIQVLWRG